MKKKLLSMIMCVIMVICLLPSVALADTPIDDSSTVVAKIGDTEYTDLATALNAAKAAEDTVTLETDITLTGEWTPISGFKGTFDGQNHTIYGLKITSANGSNGTGLFATIGRNDGAPENPSNVVKNLTIDGAVINLGDASAEYVGVLAGNAGGSTIENVTVKNATITTNAKYVGGLFGMFSAKGKTGADGHFGTLQNCKVMNTNIQGKDQVGGLVGYLVSGEAEGCELTNNTIVANEERAGGIFGKMAATSGDDSNNRVVKNCKVSGGSATAPDLAGGITAQFFGDFVGYSITGNTVENFELNAAEISAFATIRLGSPYSNDTFLNALSTNVTGNTFENLFAGESLQKEENNYGFSVYKKCVAKIGKTYYATISEAITKATADQTVELIDDVTVADNTKKNNEGIITINKNLVIDGGGHTITFAQTTDSSKEASGINIESSAQVTLKNLTLEANKTAKHGINIYGGDVTLENVTVKNFTGYGMVVQHSSDDTTKTSNATISGGAIKNVAYLYNDEVVETLTGASLTITGGKFGADPSKYCAKNKIAVAGGDSEYPFVVEDKPENVEIAETAPAKVESGNVNIDKSGLDANQIAAVDKEVEKAAEAIGNTSITGLEVAAATEATSVTEKDVTDAKEKLKTTLAKVDGAEKIETETKVNVFVQPYLDIKIAGAKVETEGSGTDTTGTITELTLEIVPMVKTIASTATEAKDIVTADQASSGDTKKQNAVEIGDAKEVKVTTSVTITIPLPAGFVTNEETKLYVTHTKDSGASYVYTANVTSSGKNQSKSYFATFTNPNGFSRFGVGPNDASVAKIGDVGYTSLQAAVNAVKNGDTIKLVTNAGIATVNRTVSFTVEKGKFDCTINLGSNSRNNSKVDGTYDVVYTAPSYSGGGSSSGSSGTDPTKEDTKDTGDTEAIEEKDSKAAAATLAKNLILKVRSSKTAKGNIKVTLKVNKKNIKAIKDLGYTVTYKFSRSTKASSAYKAKAEKAIRTYTDKTGKKGTKYYYKARVMVYDAQGTLIAKTSLKQCKYAVRVK